MQGERQVAKAVQLHEASSACSPLPAPRSRGPVPSPTRAGLAALLQEPEQQQGGDMPVPSSQE